MDMIVQKVLNTVQTRSLLQPNDTVYVALSGGADSVTLLRILCEIREHLHLADVRALHMNHGLRGEQADNDTVFVEQLCSALNVSLVVSRVNVAKEAEISRESVEEAGRRLRYSFFQDAVKGVVNAKIATAHTADDRVESVLLNITRGCGIHGLIGIPESRDNIVRPLYDCTAAEVRDFCFRYGYEYCIDETNADVTFARNRVRHNVLPQLACINENVTRNVLRLSDIAKEEDVFLQQQADEALSCAVVDDMYLSVEVLRKIPLVLQKRVLMTATKRFGHCQAEMRHIEELCALVRGECCAVSLPDRVTAKVKNDLLRWIPERSTAKQPIDAVRVIPSTEVLFGNDFYDILLISREEYQNTLKIHKNLFNFCISYDMINGDLVLRTREIGDTIRPYKRGCKKTLKKFFNEQNIPIENRDRFPLLCDDDGVLAVLGLSIDEKVAVSDQTQRILWMKKRSE